jgi:hypothetical protein
MTGVAAPVISQGNNKSAEQSSCRSKQIELAFN